MSEGRARRIYVITRLAGEGGFKVQREELIQALSHLTRAAGMLGELVAEETPDANILTEGEGIDRYLVPVKRRGDYAGQMSTRQKLLLDRHFPCHDAPVLFPPTAAGNRHTWTQHPDALSKDQIRGYHRLRCAVCTVEGEADTSG